MTKTYLKNYNNNNYRPGNFFVIIIWYFLNHLIIKNSFITSSSFKIILLKLFGSKIGKGVIIKPGVSIKYPWNLIIGDYCWVGEDVWIDNLEMVIIENNVCVSQGAMLLCGNHNYKKSEFNLIVSKIIIKNGAWIGAKSIVCPGVIVDNHSVLSVGSVATQNMEPYSIYQGNPAKKIKNRVIE